ncbi:sensor histidine kinase [Chitinophaga qingshengii]|uniref:Sensor histidine kinase n=1 Tax=Chitinophaga qingshengii TaxID=1569794 RepID=A0ABR7TWZ1_9BACT|nr:sensor histidine kinase [Chitinophaga qingshengii]MBC9935000.1 sensor histidine kinase [Chitinophaga qingshengii]
MNFQENEPLFSSKLFLYLSRILVLFTFSIIFKSFDHTFVNDLRLMDVRGWAFSAFYVAFGLLVWEGAVWLARVLEKRIGGGSASRRLTFLCCALVLYGMVAALGFGFLYAISDIVLFHRYEAWESFKRLSYDLNFGIFMFYLLILTFNGIIYYYTAWKEYQVQAERLKRENIQARYDALRNQIDPHFFFNSLSVLTNLVYKSPDLSADYITQLAKTYRYILDKKFENLVTVQTELDFLESYLFLMRIRHQQSIQFRIDIDDKVRHKGMIPPVSLQLLIENAIKHNRFSSADPLVIEVKDEGDCLVVANRIRRKNSTEISSGIGLENIQKRYALISDHGIEVIQSDDLFIVKIPIITAT